MTSILGIDAAWTARQPSGVALVARTDGGRWQCISVAPSYDAFLRAAGGHPVSWTSSRFAGAAPNVGRLLAAAEHLLGGRRVDLATVDMPVSRKAIIGRRACDDAVSREFGAAGCSTHSPNSTRPGSLGAELTAAFGFAGYPVATADDAVGEPSRLLEVYPHPPLLRLMNANRRLESKVGKYGKYWPGASIYNLTPIRRPLSASPFQPEVRLLRSSVFLASTLWTRSDGAKAW